MKRIIIFSAVLFGVHSCDSKKEKDAHQRVPIKTLEKSSHDYTRQYEIYTLDGCEYIVVGLGGNRWGSHKGDCKSPIHLTNEEVHTAN